MTVVLAGFLLYSVFLAAFAWWRPRPRNAGHAAGLNFWIVILGAEVAAFFSGRKVGAVHCRIAMRNSLRGLDFTTTEDGSQRRRDAFGHVKLGGNGQFIRLTALMRLGDNPWTGSLGIRLHLAGVAIRYAANAVVTQEASPRLDLRSLKYVRKLTLPRAAALVAPWSAGATGSRNVRVDDCHGQRYLARRTACARSCAAIEAEWRAVAADAGGRGLYPVFLLLRIVSPWRALIRMTNVVPLVPPRLLPWTDGHPGLSARRP